MKIKNILVPVDFSECSKNALLSGIDIAKKTGAKIHMVNSVHVHSPHPDISGGLIEQILADYEESIKTSFQELESELIELQDVPHAADRFIATLTDAIYTKVRKKDIDLIVMGTRAQHKTMEYLVGTRANEVIDTVEVPVLVIPEYQSHFTAQKIGLACEYAHDVYMQDFTILKDLCLAFNSELLVFSISEDPSKLTLEDQKVIEKLRHALEPVKASVRTVEADSVTKGIENFIGGHDLDMMAMIPKKKSFFERLFKKSVTKSLTTDTKLPILVFKED